MINHVRTLLLDADGPAPTAGDGEEFVPADYRAAAPPEHLRRVRAVLFGRAPDRRMRLYRVRQFMAVLHATPLAEFVAAADQRLTYLPLDAGRIAMPGGTTAAPVAGAGELSVSGDPPAEDGTGRTTFRWTVESGAGLTITAADGTATTTAFTYADGLSQAIAVPGSRLTVRARAADAGATWLLEHLATPGLGLGDLMPRLATVGEDALAALFGVDAAEPYRTWRRLWGSDEPLPYRLGALLLAVARRTEESRRREA